MSFNDLTAKLHVSATAAESSTKTIPDAVSYSDGTACICVSESSTTCSTNSSTGPLMSVPPESEASQTSPNTTTTSSISDDGGVSSAAAKTDSNSPMEDQSKVGDMEPDRIDMDMPATEIGRRTTRMLSQYLRPPKINACDWQDMAEHMGFNYQLEIQNFAMESDPVARVLAAWSTKRGSTIGKLMEILEAIERDDVLTQLPQYLETDCKRWRAKLAETQEPIQVAEVSGNFYVQTTSQELRGITLNDSPGGPPERFDAYVCFANSDLTFVQELIKELESPPHSYKLCIDARDLIPGGSHAVVTAEIIQNRCNKMLVILSPEFLNSPSCDFQTKFAVSLDAGARSRRIIPIVIKPCTVPPILRHIATCNFTREDLKPWLWDRLKKAMALR